MVQLHVTRRKVTVRPLPLLKGSNNMITGTDHFTVPIQKIVIFYLQARDLHAFSCTPNILRGFITPLNPSKMRSIGEYI